MIQPGAKNWIDKYIWLIENNNIDLSSLDFSKIPVKRITKKEYLYQLLFNTGIIFSHPVDFLFFKDKETVSKWTKDEKTSLLLMESLTAVYINEKKQFDKADFLDSLIAFYDQYKDKYTTKILNLLKKENNSEQLEKIIKTRIHIKKTISNQLWFNYFNNNLIFLDVLAYNSFLVNKKKLTECYDNFLSGVLSTVGLIISKTKTEIEESDYILSNLLEASNWDEKEKTIFLRRIKTKKITFRQIKELRSMEDLYKFYLIDIAILVANPDLSIVTEKIELLQKLCKYLNVNVERLLNSTTIMHRFVIENNHQITFFQEKKSYEQLYANFSKRWVKVIERNKHKLVEELKESKEFVALVNKSLKEDLSTEEKEKVKEQFKDIVKSVPALAIFLLPGGMILLPIVLKIIPDLLPSSFKQNNLDS